MSVEAITWALKRPVPSSPAKFVLVVLANQASAETGVAYPSVAYLAQATGQDRKTVMSSLKKLCEWGLIEDTGKRTGQTKQVIVYRLALGGDLFAEASQNRNSSETGTVPKTEQSRISPEQYRISPEGSQKRDTEPLEPSGTVKRNAQRTALRFDEFWSAYPKKRGKKQTREAWKSKCLDARADELIADVKKRTAQDARWKGGFAPDPVRYITGERWEDEIEHIPGAAQASGGGQASPAREETPLERDLNWLRQQNSYGCFTPEEYKRRVAEVTEKHRQQETA